MSDFSESPKTHKDSNDVLAEKGHGLQPTASPGEADVGEIEETRNGQFHRSFSPRQVHVRLQSWLMLGMLV